MSNTALLAFALHANVAWALAPGETQTLPCRPTIACTAEIVPPGAFEVEVGVLVRRTSSIDRQWTLPFLAKLTLASWVQLQVGSNGYTLERGAAPAAFFDNVQVGAKFHILDQRPVVPSVSVSLLASLPTAASEGYVGSYGGLVGAYVTKDLGAVHADLNLGANLFGLDSKVGVQEWAALALSTPLPPPFGAMVEAYYFTPASPFVTHDGGVLFAISHSPKPWIMFDFGGDVGFFPRDRAYSVFVGMSLIPVLLWKS